MFGNRKRSRLPPSCAGGGPGSSDTIPARGRISGKPSPEQSLPAPHEQPFRERTAALSTRPGPRLPASSEAISRGWQALSSLTLDGRGREIAYRKGFATAESDEPVRQSYL